jgi:RNA polymerase sigma factor (sigma-70 family)
VRALVDDWEPVVAETAKRRARCPATREAISQAGRQAVIDAAIRFQPDLGSPFTHYATKAIANETRKAAMRVQSPTTDIALEAVPSIPVDSGSPVRRLAIREWLNACPRLLQKVFVALYRRGYNQRETARRLGVSQPRVTKLHSRLIQEARTAFTGIDWT